MTRLPDLERALIEAAERLDADARVTAAHRGREHGGLRARWARMSRRGHVAGILAGGLVLGAVATGSAQVAGLNPLGFDVQGKTDPALALSGDPLGSVNVTSAPDSARQWRVNAWVARNGKLCVTGGLVDRSADDRSEFIYFCRTTDRAAQEVLSSDFPTRAIVGAVQLGAPSMRPRQALAFALTPIDAPDVEFAAASPAKVRTSDQRPVLRLPVERSTSGLSPAGARFVRSLPAELNLRLTVAEVDSPAPIATNGDLAAYEAPGRARSDVAQIHVTSQAAWKRLHPRSDYGRVDPLLERDPQPVEHQTHRQELTYPVLTRPRHRGDAIPTSMITPALQRGRIQTRLSHQLRVSGEGSLGRIWIAPGAMHADSTAPSLDGRVCLAGPRVLSGCHSTPADGRRPDVEAVMCAPGLDRQQFLTWAHVPAGATQVRVTFADGSTARYATGDLLVLLRPRSKPLPTRIDWSGPAGFAKAERGPFPADAASKRCGTGQARYWELRRSASSSAEGHR